MSERHSARKGEGRREREKREKEDWRDRQPHRQAGIRTDGSIESESVKGSAKEIERSQRNREAVHGMEGVGSTKTCTGLQAAK